MSLNHAQTPNDLSHVLWMGGSPCAGKSTIARLLADRRGLRAYYCDEAFAYHRQLIDPERQPMLHKWTSSSWDELWMQPVETLLSEAIACYREHFQLVLADLLCLTSTQPVFVEGNCLLPDDLYPWLRNRGQAIWMVTTADFVRTHYPKRGSWVQDIVSQCSDPHLAFQNWMDREVQFAAWVTQRVLDLGLKLLLVDGTQTIAATADQVEAHFGLSTA